MNTMQRRPENQGTQGVPVASAYGVKRQGAVAAPPGGPAYIDPMCPVKNKNGSACKNPKNSSGVCFSHARFLDSDS